MTWDEVGPFLLKQATIRNWRPNPYVTSILDGRGVKSLSLTYRGDTYGRGTPSSRPALTSVHVGVTHAEWQYTPVEERVALLHGKLRLLAEELNYQRTFGRRKAA